MKYANRKLVVLMLILTFFSCVNCLGQENKDSIEIWVKEIKKECDRIKNDSAKLKVERKSILGQSTEGGLSEKFYDGNTLRKAILTFFGETGKSTSEYYFLNEEIIFVYDKEVRYKSPIYMGKTETTSQVENRFYFKNQKLIRWIGNNGKTMDAALYPEKEKEILDDIKNIQ